MDLLIKALTAPRLTRTSLGALKTVLGYDAFKGASGCNISKASFCRDLIVDMVQAGVDRNPPSIKSKVRELERQYKDAYAFKHATGEGITDEAGKKRIERSIFNSHILSC